MATTKTAKVQAEIDKAKEKLVEQQNRIKELETKHTELENMEIVDIVRGLKIPLDELAATLQAVKGGAAPTSAPASSQSSTPQNQGFAGNPGGPKSKAIIHEDATINKEDETE